MKRKFKSYFEPLIDVLAIQKYRYLSLVGVYVIAFQLNLKFPPPSKITSPVNIMEHLVIRPLTAKFIMSESYLFSNAAVLQWLGVIFSAVGPTPVSE